MRDADRRLVACQRPEVVPVRMHRLGGIAFMTDRGRHQSIERAALALRVRRNSLRQTQLLHVLHRPAHPWPHVPQKLYVAGVAVDRVDEKQELAGAVVLGHGIRAAPIDAAWHLAVVELERRVPLQKIPGRIRVSETQQHLGRHCAVTDPGALVGSRSGLDRRTVAIDENMGECSSQRVEQLPFLRWQRQLDAIELFAPRCSDFIRATRVSRDGPSHRDATASRAPLPCFRPAPG